MGDSQGLVCNVMRVPVVAILFANIVSIHHLSELCETDNRKLPLSFQDMSSSYWERNESPYSSESVTYRAVRNARCLFLRPLLFWQSWLKLANGFRSYWRRGNL